MAQAKFSVPCMPRRLATTQVLLACFVFLQACKLKLHLCNQISPCDVWLKKIWLLSREDQIVPAPLDLGKALKFFFPTGLSRQQIWNKGTCEEIVIQYEDFLMEMVLLECQAYKDLDLGGL